MTLKAQPDQLLPPTEPLQCRRNAEARLGIGGYHRDAVIWALLAIAGELAESRRLRTRGS